MFSPVVLVAPAEEPGAVVGDDDDPIFIRFIYNFFNVISENLLSVLEALVAVDVSTIHLADCIPVTQLALDV